LDGARILQPASYDEIWGVTFDSGGEGESRYRGLGWWHGTYRNRHVCLYWSGDVGFHAALCLFPEAMAAGIAMGNQFTGTGYPTYAYTAAMLGIGLVTA
jgi:hypothetical protein